MKTAVSSQAMNLRVPTKAQVNFQFYLSTPLDMVGQGIGCEITHAPDGYSALECWWAKDTYGKVLPCREPEILDKVFRGKASVNLQVKLWAEGLIDSTLSIKELREYISEYPDWVLPATVNQAASKSLKTVGFVPSRLKLNPSEPDPARKLYPTYLSRYRYVS